MTSSDELRARLLRAADPETRENGLLDYLYIAEDAVAALAAAEAKLAKAREALVDLEREAEGPSGRLEIDTLDEALIKARDVLREIDDDPPIA